ncbi:response regulator [Desulfopila sp. IMCC35006]|nr:response regulator [Desulfopila sp. IMCC35006]
MSTSKRCIFPQPSSLKVKLLLWVMPIVVTGFLSLNLGAYWYIENVIEDALSKSMLASVGKSAESINRWLATIMIEPETIAATPAAQGVNRDFSLLDSQNINRHKILHAKHPDIFQDIYAANRHGEYHTIQPKGDGFEIFIGDIRNRPYFQSIMAGGPTQITPPLISRTTGIPTIFMVSPIVDEQGQPQGLIGAGISLQYIQKIAEELRAGQTGYGFVLAKDGTFIFHPEAHFIMQSNIMKLENSSMKALGAKMLSGSSGLFRYFDKGQIMLAFFQPVPIAGWSVATVLPEAELYAPAIKMIKLLAGLTCLFIVLVGTAILLAVQNLTRPLQLLATRAEDISAGNLEMEALAIQSHDELGTLSDAFNAMTANLQTTMRGLRQSEDNYRSIFENSLLGIVQTSLDGRVLNANPAIMQMLGYDSFQEMAAALTDIHTQLYVVPEDRQQIIALLLEYGKVQGREVQFFRRDKTMISVVMNMSLIRSPTGEPIRIESLVTDISDRKKAEYEREVLQEQLIQAQKLEAVGQLAGGVAHDFNNMLSVIIGKTELALLKVQPSDPFYKTFVDIGKAAEHSANLTRQLLTFARKQTVALKVIDLNEVLGEMLTMLRRLIGEDIELIQMRASNLWPIQIDPDQVCQILANLCVNARDAIEGIGKICIETKNASFDKAACAMIPDCQPGDYVCLTVSDDGSGIDQETLAHIFEPFFTTKKIDKGTGLGLSTVYGIVQQNRGVITTKSEVGHGTSFSLYFPRFRGDAQHSPAQKKEEVLARGSETVLLVEDELSLLEMAREMLEKLGYTVLAANSPEDAVRLAEQHAKSIQLLLTDVVMPVMNGRDLADLLRAVQPDLQCLFMSGYTDNIITHQDLQDKSLHFLQKPFLIQDLAHKVREILDLGTG